MFDHQSLVMDCQIQYESLRQKWQRGEHIQATQQLSNLVHFISSRSSSSSGTSSKALSELHLECLLKLGIWKLKLIDPGTTVDSHVRKEVLGIFANATLVDPHSYRAWHEWGMSNLHAVIENNALSRNKSPNKISINNPSRRPSVSSEDIYPTVVNALRGLMRAVTLGTRKYSALVMQDMLSILRCWFRYGENPIITVAIEEGLKTVPLDNWLGVVPQLVARIHHHGDAARTLLHGLLTKLGQQHAQALMYPLSVALQSPREDRKKAAESLVQNIKLHSGMLLL
jgi:FKBP12-rapamycin complex-associated protein